MSRKSVKRSKSDDLGLSAAERACFKLGILDSVISTLDRFHGEYCNSIRSGESDVGSPCSFVLRGFEASYLLKSLKAVRNATSNPFGIEAASRANRSRSVPEKASLAREVKAEIESGKTRYAALLIVGARHKMNGTGDKELSSALAKIYDQMKDFV